MPTATPVQCAQIDMQADVAECDAQICRLREHARISCGNLLLFADAIDIRFDAQHQFAGAEASGHTTLVQNEVVATCQKATVAADQITGAVLAATIAVRAPGAKPDAAGVPRGRNASVLRGDIERLSPTHFVAHGGDFTACDCGPEAAPSWRLGASTVDVEVGERALIWGPQLYINPLIAWGWCPSRRPCCRSLCPCASGRRAFCRPSRASTQTLGWRWTCPSSCP